MTKNEMQSTEERSKWKEDYYITEKKEGEKKHTRGKHKNVTGRDIQDVKTKLMNAGYRIIAEDTNIRIDPEKSTKRTRCITIICRDTDEFEESVYVSMAAMYSDLNYIFTDTMLNIGILSIYEDSKSKHLTIDDRFRRWNMFANILCGNVEE